MYPYLNQEMIWKCVKTIQNSAQNLNSAESKCINSTTVKSVVQIAQFDCNCFNLFVVTHEYELRNDLMNFIRSISFHFTFSSRE